MATKADPFKTEVNTQLRKWINDILIANEWTSNTLATKAGVASSTINRFINGSSTTLSYDTVARVSCVSGKDIPQVKIKGVLQNKVPVYTASAIIDHIVKYGPKSLETIQNTKKASQFISLENAIPGNIGIKLKGKTVIIDPTVPMKNGQEVLVCENSVLAVAEKKNYMKALARISAII